MLLLTLWESQHLPPCTCCYNLEQVLVCRRIVFSVANEGVGCASYSQVSAMSP